MPKTFRTAVITSILLSAAGIGGGVIFSHAGNMSAATTNAAVEKDPAVERARREVRMLDDIYKTAIVLVTEHYVHDDTDLAAGTAFKALFDAVGKKGWHEVHLVDATGEPYNDLNLPKDGFEKDAVKQILGGKSTVDSVVEEGDKKYLLAATAIPVVMEKCIMCHENYRSVAKGQAIGVLSYKLPILD